MAVYIHFQMWTSHEVPTVCGTMNSYMQHFLQPHNGPIAPKGRRAQLGEGGQELELLPMEKLFIATDKHPLSRRRPLTWEAHADLSSEVLTTAPEFTIL